MVKGQKSNSPCREIAQKKTHFNNLYNRSIDYKVDLRALLHLPHSMD